MASRERERERVYKGRGERENWWRRRERGAGGGRRAFAGAPLLAIMVDAREGFVFAEGDEKERSSLSLPF